MTRNTSIRNTQYTSSEPLLLEIDRGVIEIGHGVVDNRSRGIRQYVPLTLAVASGGSFFWENTFFVENVLPLPWPLPPAGRFSGKVHLF